MLLVGPVHTWGIWHGWWVHYCPAEDDAVGVWCGLCKDEESELPFTVVAVACVLYER